MILSRTTAVLKALPDGRFEGLAWAFASTPDIEGDIILPSALELAAKAVPIPVLIEHRGQPIGEIQSADVTADGLTVKGALDTGIPAGREAYALAKSGELSGLSMGFSGEAEKSGPIRVFRSVRLNELSVCRAPINAGSRMTAIKSWPEIQSERELERLLKSIGMPNRLAQKCASASWPVIQNSTQQPTADLVAALRHLSRS